MDCVGLPLAYKGQPGGLWEGLGRLQRPFTEKVWRFAAALSWCLAIFRQGW